MLFTLKQSVNDVTQLKLGTGQRVNFVQGRPSRMPQVPVRHDDHPLHHG
jgi:hypothetical protein